MDQEIQYLRYLQLQRTVEAQDVRIQVLEHFILEKFPMDFAGVVGTVADPDLKPIELDLQTKPQEAFDENTQKWNGANS